MNNELSISPGPPSSTLQHTSIVRFFLSRSQGISVPCPSEAVLLAEVSGWTADVVGPPLPVGPTLPVVLVPLPLLSVAAGMAAVNGPVRTAVLHVAAVFAPVGGNTDAAAPPMAVGLAGIATAPIAAMVPIAAALPRTAESLAAMDLFAAILHSAAPSVAVLQSAHPPTCSI